MTSAQGRNVPRRDVILESAIAVSIVALVASALVFLSGGSPVDVLVRIVAGTWGTPYGLAQVLFKATPLLLSGLAAHVAFRAGLFNVGAEGQMTLGGLAAAIVGGTLASDTSAFVALPLSLCAAALAGALWVGIPALLRARFGTSEVITTILLNFVAMAFGNWIVAARFHVADTTHTPEIIAGARLGRLADLFEVFRGSPVNAALLIALVLLVVVAFVLKRTPLGRHVDALGRAPRVAETVGVPVASLTVGALLVSGAIAGLGGTSFVLGYKGYFETGFAAGGGYLGIAVALLAGTRTFAIVAGALLFATLSEGSLLINAIVPRELVDVLVGVTILAVVGLRARLRMIEARELAGRGAEGA